MKECPSEIWNKGVRGDEIRRRQNRVESWQAVTHPVGQLVMLPLAPGDASRQCRYASIAALVVNLVRLVTPPFTPSVASSYRSSSAPAYSNNCRIPLVPSATAAAARPDVNNANNANNSPPSSSSLLHHAAPLHAHLLGHIAATAGHWFDVIGAARVPALRLASHHPSPTPCAAPASSGSRLMLHRTNISCSESRQLASSRPLRSTC
ncbi:hypothetical protein EJ02DRAFT_486299 [Clathrospora elynae]|uniref:Uncharacterized protein n=1 Tax=Clathrospora elynae TaxID=706981 RepID=A0A6A5ST66_9PLEO|nr:hypothetical protein EJ02DRAFT_486299 [Clathrospora elynae]